MSFFARTALLLQVSDGAHRVFVPGQRRRTSPVSISGDNERMEDAVMARTAALPSMTAEGGLTRYMEEIRRFPILEPLEEFLLGKRWREGDRDAAHQLVTSHLRLV